MVIVLVSKHPGGGGESWDFTYKYDDVIIGYVESQIN